MVENLHSILFFTSIPIYVLGFVGNVLVIRIVHKTPPMHTTTNYLLVNLAVADVITVLLWPLFSSYSCFKGYFSNGVGNFICKFTAFTEMSVMASSFTLTVLAVERYHALLKPLRIKLRLTEDNIKQAIALIWLSSFLVCLPEFFLREWKEPLSTCVGPWTIHMNTESGVYFFINSLFSAYFPLAVMTYCYASVIRGLYLTNVICSESVANAESNTEKKKLVVTFILAAAGFFVCFAPSVVFFTVLVLKPAEEANLKSNFDLSVLFAFLFLFSLCFNPVLYAFRSSNFRAGFKRIIFCLRPTPQNNNVELE